MTHSHRRENEVRLSDAERSAAMASLGRALAEGRLSVDEYDQRCREVAAAERRGELSPLFTDLPVEQSGVSGSAVEKLYSAQEIEAAYQAGRRPRAGLLGLSTVGSVAGAIALSATTPLSWLLLAIIPVVAILLYVMKVGPDTWYVPSPRTMEKARIRELKAADRIRSAELRAERRERTAELTGEAMDFAKRALDRRKPR